MSAASEPDDDLAYLAELLRDFGVPDAPDPETALVLVTERFRVMFERVSSFGTVAQNLSPERWGLFGPATERCLKAS